MILDALDDVNWAAVAVAAATAFAIGSVWFAPPVLGDAWARQVSAYTGASGDEINADATRAPALAKWLLGIVVTAVTLALAVKAVGADRAGDGIVLGAVLWAGLAAAFFSWPAIFARMPWRWWLISSGAFLLMLIAMGAILGAWE